MPFGVLKPLALGLVLAASFHLAACQTLPGTTPAGGETITVQQLRERLLARQNAVRNLRSFVRTTVEARRRMTFNQVLLVEGGGAVRMDTLSMFGQTLGVFIHSPVKTLLYEPARNTALEGEAVWNAMERMVGMRIDFRRYAPVFLGHIPHLENLRIDAARLSPDKSRYQIRTTHPGTGEKLEVEVEAFSLRPCLLRRQDGEYQVKWEDYKLAGGQDFPHRLVIEFPARAESVTLEFNNPSINAALPADAFEFAVPAGAEALSG